MIVVGHSILISFERILSFIFFHKIKFFSGHFLRETIELHSKPSAMAALSDGAARRDSADP